MFTCHDLRRLKAQLAEVEFNDTKAAAAAIGDKTDAVVTTHYASTSLATQVMIDDRIDSRFNHIMGDNAR